MGPNLFRNSRLKVIEKDGTVKFKNYGLKSFSKEELKEALNQLFGTGKVKEVIYVGIKNIAERFLVNNETDWYSVDLIPWDETYIQGKDTTVGNRYFNFLDAWKNIIINKWNDIMSGKLEEPKHATYHEIINIKNWNKAIDEGFVPKLFDPSIEYIDRDNNYTLTLEKDFSCELEEYKINLKYIFQKIYYEIEDSNPDIFRNLKIDIDESFGDYTAYISFTFPTIINNLVCKY